MKKYDKIVNDINKEISKHEFCWNASTKIPAISKFDDKIQKISNLDQITITKIEDLYEDVSIPLGIEVSNKIKKYLIKQLKKEKKVEVNKIIQKWESVK